MDKMTAYLKGILFVSVLLLFRVGGEEKDPSRIDLVNPNKKLPKNIALVAKKIRPSIVVVTQEGREGKTVGTGTGFVISENGLIATCAHVIGESRLIKVRFDDGNEYKVEQIFASDRKLDLAILKINAKDLKPLQVESTQISEQGS